jgi:2',3'-cyclic-nucleotide 2'-phosphodiesterase/3'-nucleotidase
MEFLPIEDIAQSMIDEVKKMHNPDFTLLAIHAGLGDGSGNDVENPARFLAATLKGIDAVLSSHDHQRACEKIWNGTDSVLVMEGGSRCNNLIKVVVDAKFENGKLISKTLNGELVPMEGTAVDNDYLTQFSADYLKTKAFTNQEIGSLENDINTVDAFFGPSSYLNLIHSVQLAESGADISMAAPLTYNGRVEAGKLIYHDLFTIYPFENQLYVISLTGKQILDCLEYSYDTWISTMKSSKDHLLRIRYDENRGSYNSVYPAFNFDSAAGLVYDVDVREPFGSRVKIKSLADGTKFNLNNTYKVAMSSYRANGGGDLLTKGAGIPKEQLPSIIVDKKDDIRGMIYNFYRSGSSKDRMIEAQWKFIPETMVKDAIERDRSLVFGKK